MSHLFKSSTHLKVADLHVQGERIEHHGADEGDARCHGVHDLEFAVGRVRWLVSDFFFGPQLPTLDFAGSGKESPGQSIHQSNLPVEPEPLQLGEDVQRLELL